VIPDLGKPGQKEAWYRLETAKRRLVYSLLNLDVPVLNKLDDSKDGLSFEFLADPDPDGKDAKPVLTGHADGVITINLAEADSAEREKRRIEMNEPYRTVLGHFRHEVGHYYWDRLIRDSDRLADFRALFVDDQKDYQEALKHHYSKGPNPEWQQQYVSAYASVHPWEDWAETWAHYLHTHDVLESAYACGLTLRPRGANEPKIKAVPRPRPDRPESFNHMIKCWFPLTYLLNNLNRDLGLPDGYPFVLSEPVIEKLRFVHETIGSASS